ncbi:MAG: recombinase family protein [Clostridia bacterium]|nr:recombinase family protein [Clostridia bacterium]
MKTILYARSATPNPEAIEKQLAELQEYADNWGYTDCEAVIDDGYSGAGTLGHWDRPGFVHMMEEVDNDEVATVLVVDLARLSRNMVAVQKIISELTDYDVHLIALTEEYDNMANVYNPNDSFMDMLNMAYQEMKERKRL